MLRLGDLHLRNINVVSDYVNDIRGYTTRLFI